MTSAWGRRDDLKNVISPTSASTKDECGGYLSHPLLEFKCQHVIRKWPKQLCNTLFKARSSQTDVCKTYCEKHRYCFLPLANQTRCHNYRRAVDKLYCSLHGVEEKQCGKMVGQYKRQCGDNTLDYRCLQKDDVDLLERKAELFKACRIGRMLHHKKCIHPSVQSSGHLHFLRNVGLNETQCNNMLWHDAPVGDYDSTESYTDTDDDDDDIFYDLD